MSDYQDNPKLSPLVREIHTQIKNDLLQAKLHEINVMLEVVE